MTPLLLGSAAPDPLTALLIGLAALAAGFVLFWPDGGLLSRHRKLQRLSARVLGEDALKYICSAELDGSRATVQSVAGTLEISINKTAQLLQGLEERGLVAFQENEVRLTPQGHDYALHIVRTHRLWEQYLADQTGWSETEWHRLAHRHEHELSPEAVNALSARLGNPSHDPHGDPIPTASGEVARAKGVPLTEAPAGQPVRIVHVEDEPEATFKQIVADGLSPRMVLHVVEKTPQRILFWAEGNRHVLAPSLASNIFVTPVSDPIVPEDPAVKRLSSLRPGETARVLRISRACRSANRRRLLDLGFVPGTVVEVAMVSPMKDPTAYRVRGTLMALRREQADMIQVGDAEEAPA
jgi:DtxR family Mn-dependent transcriptional regulator